MSCYKSIVCVSSFRILTEPEKISPAKAQRRKETLWKRGSALRLCAKNLLGKYFRAKPVSSAHANAFSVCIRLIINDHLPARAVLLTRYLPETKMGDQLARQQNNLLQSPNLNTPNSNLTTSRNPNYRRSLCGPPYLATSPGSIVL
jgi:hypothetical protein